DTQNGAEGPERSESLDVGQLRAHWDDIQSGAHPTELAQQRLAVVDSDDSLTGSGKGFGVEPRAAAQIENRAGSRRERSKALQQVARTRQAALETTHHPGVAHGEQRTVVLLDPGIGFRKGGSHARHLQ